MSSRNILITRVVARTEEELKIFLPEWANDWVKMHKGWMVFESVLDADKYRKELEYPQVQWDPY